MTTDSVRTGGRSHATRELDLAETGSSIVHETKLRPPRARAGMLRRPRLFDLIDKDSALTLVAAPVGYGKTMLLSSWCAERRASVIWNTLDSDDHDPVRMWTHLAAAASRARRGLGSRSLAHLAVTGSTIETAIDSLLTSIARQEEPVAIVLDDLDAIGGGESLQSIEHAIGRLPANARVVAATRSDPPLDPQLRAKHLLAEIRPRQLAFTPDEARELIVRTEAIALSEESVALLTERTEGWPAALYLAALWLRDQPDPDDAARRFGASARQVADYLFDGILASLNDETRRFLARTAVLGRFTPELCDAVLERDDSRVLLSALERSNLFLVALDGPGDWFRYHHLFQELLRLELRDASERNALLWRAAVWCRDHGLVEEAINHAAGAGDLDFVADILLRTGPDLGRGRRTAFIQSWVERLPPELLLERPAVAALGAMAAALRGRPPVEVERMLLLAEQSRRDRPAAWTTEVEAYVAAARSLTIDNDDARMSLEEARVAVDVASSTLKDQLVGALSVLARSLFFVGDLAAAREAAHQAVTRPESADRPYGYVLGLGLLAAIDAEEKRPEHAIAWATQAIDYAREHGLASAWFGAFAHLGLSAAYSETGKAGDAEREASRAEVLRRGPQASMSHAYALLRLANARIDRSRLSQASDALSAARREIAEFRDPGRLPSLVAAVEARLADAPTDAPDSIERPSSGELAVLRYLPSHLSQREIAAELYISLNTLRTHVRALYRKLNVHTRDEAVARADALGLLAETHHGDPTNPRPGTAAQGSSFEHGRPDVPRRRRR